MTTLTDDFFDGCTCVVRDSLVLTNSEIRLIRELLQKFKEKEEYCKENGDPIQMIVEKLNEHTAVINKLTEKVDITN